MRFSVFIATSLDGFIARADGALDWLDAANQSVPEGEDCGYATFMADIDCIVMGRKTFEKVLSFGDWPYGDLPVRVWSRTLCDLPARLPASVQPTSSNLDDVVVSLKAEKFAHVYVDGGQTIQAFLQAGLIRDLTITSIPVLLGQGISLFDGLGTGISLKHVRTKVYDFGFVQTTYSIEPTSA